MKRVQKLGMLACALALGFVLMGCASSFKSSDTGTTANIGIPAKNIKILGIVRYESVVDQGNGEKVTYDALLKAAEALDGNGIANIMIDVKRESTKIFGFTISSKETWYGSALAIKYTDDNLAPSTPLSTSESEVAPKAGLF